MDSAQHRPTSADDNFTALDFGDESGHDSGEQSVIDATLDDEPAEFDETGTEPRAIDTLPGDTGDAEDTEAADDESPFKLTTVTNPPETVSVTASIFGRIHSVELSADAARMTESELADEILIVADLARQQEASSWRTALQDLAAEALRTLDVDKEDDGTLADRLENGLMHLPSPEQAAEAKAEVFATRYTSDQGSSPGR